MTTSKQYSESGTMGSGEQIDNKTIPVEEKNTSERPINLVSTTKKYEAHQTSTGMYTTNKLLW